jgi:hypothetical protein
MKQLTNHNLRSAALKIRYPYMFQRRRHLTLRRPNARARERGVE